MNRALLFYVIDERTDAVDYCKRKGMKPYEFTEILVDNQIYSIPIQYTYKGYNYIVLNCAQCYSGYDTTLMRLPKLSYEELLKTATTSEKHQEIVGSIGVILKEYPSKFEMFLNKSKNEADISSISSTKRVAVTISKFIKHNTSYVNHLTKILNLCSDIALL